jgi:hypothetical protein
MSNEALKARNVSKEDVFQSQYMQNAYDNSTLHCKVVKPPLPEKIGLNQFVNYLFKLFNKLINDVQVRIGLHMPDVMKGGYYMISVCYNNELFPNYNFLYGCDYVAPNLPIDPIPKDQMLNIGIEIKRTKLQNLNTKENPCQTSNIQDIYWNH